jgi:hypothetical protein
VIEVDAPRPGELARVAAALGGLERNGVQIDEATRRVTVEVDGDADGLMQALRCMAPPIARYRRR